jgi:hypothetical protein
MRTRQFFYVCAGVLLLVVAHSVGASRAQSQSPTAHVVAAAPFGQNNASVIAFLDDGRVYRGSFAYGPGVWEEMTPVPGTPGVMP